MRTQTDRTQLTIDEQTQSLLKNIQDTFVHLLHLFALCNLFCLLTSHDVMCFNVVSVSCLVFLLFYCIIDGFNVFLKPGSDQISRSVIIQFGMT